MSELAGGIKHLVAPRPRLLRIALCEQRPGEGGQRCHARIPDGEKGQGVVPIQVV
jgi:hypothetical protein